MAVGGGGGGGGVVAGVAACVVADTVARAVAVPVAADDSVAHRQLQRSSALPQPSNDCERLLRKLPVKSCVKKLFQTSDLNRNSQHMPTDIHTYVHTYMRKHVCYIHTYIYRFMYM